MDLIPFTIISISTCIDEASSVHIKSSLEKTMLETQILKYHPVHSNYLSGARYGTYKWWHIVYTRNIPNASFLNCWYLDSVHHIRMFSVNCENLLYGEWPDSRTSNMASGLFIFFINQLYTEINHLFPFSRKSTHTRLFCPLPMHVLHMWKLKNH